MAEPAVAPQPIWEFDGQAGILKIKGQEFKLLIKKDDLIPYSELILTWSRTGTSLREAIETFERGQWPNYTNASDRIRVLHHEKHLAELQLRSLAAQFQTFFEPAGIYEALGKDNRELNLIIRKIMDDVTR